MRWSKWIKPSVASVMLLTAIFTHTANVSASKASIEDESIYDVLVDRFFNGSGLNDQDVNMKDSSAFNGGDFKGLSDKRDFVKQMGFSIVSIGSVFDTLKYDGSEITSYEKLEEHFGTEEELQHVIKRYEKSDMEIMVDFPLDKVSEAHEWFQDGNNQAWIKKQQDGLISFDLDNVNVQQALKEALVAFVKQYDVHIRLTNIDAASDAFLNELIAAIKTTNASAYVISNEASDANFDVAYNNEMIDIQRSIFKTVDQNSDRMLSYLTETKPTQLLIDSPWSDRFILYAEEEDMYPPTRAKMATLSMLLLPGVPVVQYGTEIVMNGKLGPDAHQLYNFKTDNELINQIKNIQTLRNNSETLRKGQFEVIRNENGFLAFTRKSEDEQWLVLINNTSRTESVELTEQLIGENKKIRSLIELETIRADKNGNYNVVLDREMIEIYQIQDDAGINKSYLIALGIVYVVFTWFVIVIVRRGKKRRAGN